MDTFFSIEGVRTSQSSLAPIVFSNILKNFDTIIEIGTWTGAFTKWMSENVKPECKIISFDINSNYRQFQNYDRKVEKTTFIIGDVFSEENIEIIKGLIRDKHKRVLVLCDGGLKEKEFSVFSKFLKINDAIMLHDYSESEEEYNRISAEINWPTPSESHYENIKDDVNNNGLSPYLYEEFKGVLWGSFIKERPKVSVVVPAYKFSRFLEQNLLSALNQKTDFEFEVVVRDDFSQDGSDSILERLGYMFPNLRVFKAEENWGFYKNIKFLLEQARGQYIAYLDGDDYFVDPYKLQKQVDFLDNNPEYVMHSTGHCILKGENEYIPTETNRQMWATIEDVETKDLLEQNFVGFGRMFRNISGIVKGYMANLPYFDYPLNFELSLHGKIRNEDWYGGVYREHFSGVLTALDEPEKQRIHTEIKELLKKRYFEMTNKKEVKEIVIIDCFVHSESVRAKLETKVKDLKRFGFDIMLVSNTPIDKDIVENVDYYLYDSENLLFSSDKFPAEPLILYKILDDIEIYEFTTGVQRHGLSVMRNLFKSLKLAKEYGYTHFHRVEVDDIMGNDSLDTMTLVHRITDGVFFFNEKDISFHYMYCSIDFFLENVREINTDQDYYDYLQNDMNSNTFRNVEEFVRHNLDKINLASANIKTPSGSEMNKEFPDTTWNTEVSSSNLDTKYQNCTTRIYKVYRNEDGNNEEKDWVSILTYNYSEKDITRNIEVVLEDGNVEMVKHLVPGKGCWAYSSHPKNISKILVYDVSQSPSLLYTEENKNVESYIVLK